MKPLLNRRTSCCGDEPCGRAEFVELITPDDALERSVDRIAREVARACNPLDGDIVAECFAYVFDLSRECVLCDRFCAAYRKSEIDSPGPCRDRLVAHCPKRFGKTQAGPQWTRPG